MTSLAFEANLPTVRKTSRTASAAKCWMWSTTALCAVSLLARPAAAEPTGGAIVGGDGAISQVGSVTTVDQTTQKLSLTWTSLDVGEAESLVFNQPNADAIALNRVLSNLPTEFLGNLTANGNIWIINPNGIAFGPNSIVDVGGLVATTIDIPDADFWAEKFSFSALTGSGVEYSKVTADGTIMAGKGGVVLVAPMVEASGLITTAGGDVAIATARAFRVDFDGDGLLSFTVEAGAEGVLQLADSSVISAAGGAVYLSAGAADAVTESVVNVGGLVESSQVEQRGGEIILSGGLGGEVIVTAELSAPGGAGQTGGSIDVFGDTITLASGASLEVSGEAGGGKIRVGGDYQGGGDAPTASTTWVTADAMLNADATVDGDGGTVIVWSDQATVFEGSLSAVGAGFGDGGFAEISGKESLKFAGHVDLSAENGAFGTLLFDPGDINIVAGDDGDDDDQLDADTPTAGDDEGVVNAGDGGNNTFEISVDALDAINADIVLAADGDITVAADLDLRSGGDFSLTLDADDAIFVLAGVSIITDGNITFIADGDGAGPGNTQDAAIVFGANSSLESTGGNISITANTGSGGAETDSIIMAGGFSVTTGGTGTITFTSTDNIVFGAVLNDSGAQVFDDGAITVEAGGDATFSATDGLILNADGGDDDAIVVNATGALTLQVTGTGADDDLVIEDHAALNVSGGGLTLSTAGAGDIDVQNDVSINVDGAGNALSLNSADDLTLGANVTIGATGAVTLAAGDGGGVTIGDDADLDSSSDSISITALGGDTDDNDILIQGDFDANASTTILISALDEVVLGTTGSDDVLNLTAPGGVTIAGADGVSIQSVSAGGNDTTVNVLSGDLQIQVSDTDADDDIEIGDNASVTVSTGGLTMSTSGAGDIDIEDDVTITASGSVSMVSGDNIDLGEGFALTASGGTSSITVNAAGDIALATSNGGALSFSASAGTTMIADDIGFSNDENVNVTGDLTLQANSGVNITLGAGGSEFTLTDGEVDNFIVTTLTFTTDDDITVDGLTYSNADTLHLLSGNDVTFSGAASNISADLVIDGFSGADPAEALSFGANVTITGDLTATTNGAVTIGDGDGDTLDIDGAATITTSGSVTIGASDSFIVDGVAEIDATGAFTVSDDATFGVTGTASIASSDIVFGSTDTAAIVISGGGTETLTLINSAGDLMTLGATSGDTADWDISSNEFNSQIAADLVEFQTAGGVSVDGFEQASGSATIVARASGSLTLSNTNTFNENATLIAGDGDGTGSITLAGDVDQIAGALTFFGEDVTQTGGAFTASGSVAFYAGDGSGTFTGDVIVTQDGNDFANPVNAQGETVTLGTTGTLPIGLIEADDAVFDADAYDIDNSTATTFVDVGTGTATLFFGTATVTVTDAGASDSLNLASVDEDDFGFVNAGAAVGVGTEGDITVTDANWTTQGISLISTGGSVSFLTTASSFGGAVSVQSSGSITQDVALTSTGNASFASDNDIILENAGNEFSGEFNATATDATSTISIVNGFTGTMTLGEIATPGDFTLTASGDVDSADDATFEIGGSTTVTIDGATSTLVALVSTGEETTSFGGLVTIGVSNGATIDTVELGGNGLITADVTTGQTGTLGLSAFGDDADVTVDTDVELDVVDLTGDLTLGVSGSISQDATGTLSIGGTATFSADATGTIVVDNSDNDFNDVVISQAVEVDLADTNSITLVMPTDTQLSLMAASATVTSAGNLTDGASGVIDVGVLIASATGSIDFGNSNNDFGSVSATATSVTLHDSDDGVVLAGVSTTGAFTLTTADDGDAGDVAQSAPLLIGGVTTITADAGDGDITLDDFSNIFIGEVNLTGDMVFIATTATLTLGSIDASDFSFSAPNFIFDADTFNDVSGTVTFVAQPGRAFLIGEDDYLLGGGETFGIPSGTTTYVSNSQIDILEAEATVTGVGFETADNIYVDGLVTDLDVFLTASGTVQFIDGAAGTIATSTFLGDLTVNAGGAISQFNGVDNPDTTQLVFNPITMLFEEAPLFDNLTANVSVSGLATLNSSGTVTLTNAGNNFSTNFDAVSGSGTSFSIVDVNAVALGEITTSGNVSVVSGGALFVNDSITSGGGITLTSAGSIVDNDPDNEVFAATGTLTLNADFSVILDITGLQVGGTTTVNAGSTVTLSDADNDFDGAVTVTGTSLALTDANGVSFGNVTLGDTVGTNTFTVTANADGASTGSVTVTGVLDSAEVTVNAGGGDVTATNLLNDIDGTVTVTADNLSLTNTGGVTFGNTALTGDLTAVSLGGNISQNGGTTLDVDGNSSFTTPTTGFVSLYNVGNDFGGTVSVPLTSFVAFRDANDLELGAINAAFGTWSGFTSLLTADGGDVTGTAQISVFGPLNISATGNISLTNGSNNFQSILGLDGVNVTIVDTGGLTLGPTDADGFLDVTVTGGGVSSVSAITVSDTTTIEVSGAVSLAGANDFEGAVAVDAGGAVSLTDVDDILLGDIDAVGQTLTIAANTSSAITDGASAAISQASGTSILAAGASLTVGVAADIDLGESGNNFTGAVTIVSANDASITDANSLTLGTVTLSDVGADTGDLTIVAEGVTGASELNITGVTDIDSAGADVSLTNVANTFGGAVEIEARDATVAFDASGVEFGASTITRDFTLNALGDIDQSGAITGGSSLTVNVNAAGVDIALLHNTAPDDDFANDFSYFAVAGAFPANSLALRDAVGDIDFGTVDVLTDFSLSVVGSIDSSQAFDIDGNTYIEVTGANSSVTLDNAGNTFGVNASHSLTVIANGDVTVNGSSATGDVNIEGADVDLDIDFIGGVVNVAGDNTTISTGGSIMLGELDIDGDLDIDANTLGGLLANQTAISQTLAFDASGSLTTSIDVSGTTSLDAGGADIDLLNGDLFSELFGFATPDQANSFGGGVTISDAFNISLGTSSDLTITSAVSSALDTDFAQIVVLAPDVNIDGTVKAPYVYFWSSGGGTEVGVGAAGAGMSLTQTDLAHVDASQYLLIGEAADVEVKTLSLSGGALGDLNPTLGLVVYADGNVAITGEVTSPDALDLYVGPADNIYITGKLGVAGHDTLLPLGDVFLIADSDVLIGGELFVTQTDPAALELFEFVANSGDVDLLNDVLIHNVDDPLAPAQFTIIAQGNVAMQTTVNSDNPDELKGLQVGTLALQGSPSFINLFGTVVFGGQVVSGVNASLIVDNPPSTIPFSVDYEFNGCVINSPQCSGINQRPTTRPPDEDLYLDLALDPEEEEDDDPFTNRGNEEEWR